MTAINLSSYGTLRSPSELETRVNGRDVDAGPSRPLTERAGHTADRDHATRTCWLVNGAFWRPSFLESFFDDGSVQTRGTRPLGNCARVFSYRDETVAMVWSKRPSVRLGRQRCFDTPSSIESSSQTILLDAYFSRPLSQRARLAAKCDPAIIAAIVALYARRGPAAVAFWILCAGAGVWAVVVDAIQRQAWWAFAHVSPKGCEVVPPCIAHGNAAHIVATKFRARRKVTAVSCVLPCDVGARARLAVLFLGYSLTSHLVRSIRMSGQARRALNPRGWAVFDFLSILPQMRPA